MNRKFLITSSVLGLLLGGCDYQPPSEEQQETRYPREEVYVHETWSGPGWYYGIYFHNEDRYHRWYNRRSSSHSSPSQQRRQRDRKRNQQEQIRRNKQAQGQRARERQAIQQEKSRGRKQK